MIYNGNNFPMNLQKTCDGKINCFKADITKKYNRKKQKLKLQRLLNICSKSKNGKEKFS